MNQVRKKPEIINQNGVAVCSECGNPVGAPFEANDPQGRIWKKTSCAACGAVFKLEGPIKNWSAVN